MSKRMIVLGLGLASLVSFGSGAQGFGEGMRGRNPQMQQFCESHANDCQAIRAAHEQVRAKCGDTATVGDCRAARENVCAVMKMYVSDGLELPPHCNGARREGGQSMGYRPS